MSDDPTPDTEPALDEPTVFLIPIPVLDERPEAPERFYVHGTDLICQTEDGPLELSLRIKTRLQAELEDKPPREQLYIVLRSHGRDDQVEAIEDLDLIDSREIVRKYWQAFGGRNDARLGESLSSSPS